MHGVRLEFRLADGLQARVPHINLGLRLGQVEGAPVPRLAEAVPRRRLAGPLLEAVDEVEGDHGAGIQILDVLGLAPRARKAREALALNGTSVVVITRARAVAESFVR